tara:strand:- start:66 stop:386 length:321 start_codon:yes stop_codon:yes gene_type:complete
MALNDKREIPYNFRVFRLHGVAWLCDWSARTYPCTTRPHLYCEGLYLTNEKLLEVPEWTYFRESTLIGEDLPKHLVDLDPEDTAFDVSEEDAWDAAREEAQANHYV